MTYASPPSPRLQWLWVGWVEDNRFADLPIGKFGAGRKPLPRLMAPPHSSPPSLLGKPLHRGGVVFELAPPPIRLDHIWITEKCKDMNRTAILDSYFGSSFLHFGCPCGVGLPPVLVAPHPKWLTQRGAIKRGRGLMHHGTLALYSGASCIATELYPH